MINVEIKCGDKAILEEVLRIAEDCGGVVTERYDIMDGSCEATIPLENCNRTLFEQILNTKVGVIKI